MRNYLYLILFVFALCGTAKAQKQHKKTTAIQKTLDELVATNQVPGLNFSVIRKNGTQLDFSSGYENSVSKNKMKTSHLMFSGSVGKTYAAALVMRLADEKKINLDDKVLKHLPKKKWLNKITNINKLTIRMLLSHTTGLPRWVMKPEVWETLHNNPDKVWTYKDRLKFIFDMKPVHAPDKGWAYSDTNYILLGFLIETIENKNYYEVLQEKILVPRQLQQTSPSNQRKIANLAMGYSKLPPSFNIPNEVISAQGKYPFNPQMEWTGGGMASTTADLAKWCKLYYTSDIFSDNLRKQMVQVNPNGKGVFQRVHSYGMGSFVYKTKHGIAYGHSGFMPGYVTICAYYPVSGATVALQINCDYATRKMSLIGYLDKIMDSFEQVNKK